MSEQDQTKLHLHADTAADPTDGYEPIPLWLFTIFGALLLWGGWYLGAHNAGWNPYELNENAGPGTAAASQPAEDPVVLGKRIFSGICVSCHQADGKGLPGQYPTLNCSEWVAGNPAWMKRIVLDGLEGPITVKGQSYNNSMPPWGTKLTDKQIAAVITFVRTNAEWGNKAGAVSPESVAATRKAVKGRSNPWSASELLAIKTDEQPAPSATAAATTAPASTTAASATKPASATAATTASPPAPAPAPASTSTTTATAATGPAPKAAASAAAAPASTTAATTTSASTTSAPASKAATTTAPASTTTSAPAAK